MVVVTVVVTEKLVGFSVGAVVVPKIENSQSSPGVFALSVVDSLITIVVVLRAVENVMSGFVFRSAVVVCAISGFVFGN